MINNLKSKKMIKSIQQKIQFQIIFLMIKQEQLEQSALTQDKTSSNIDSTNQPNDLEKNFSNAQTFEEQKLKDQQENLGESST